MTDYPRRRLRADSPVRIGLLAGAVTSLACLVGYVVVPVVTGGAPDALAASLDVVFGSPPLPLWYHATVMVVPAAVVTPAAVLLARQRSPAGQPTDLAVLTGVVGGPVVTLWTGMAVTAVGVGLTSPSPRGLVSFVVLAAVYTLWALLFGSILAAIGTAVVLAAEGAGALAGYLLVRALDGRE